MSQPTRPKTSSFRCLPALLAGAFWALPALGLATVTMQIMFGPLADPSGAPVQNGRLWIMVYDENNDGQFPGGLGTDASLTDPAAAYSAFAGKTLEVGTMIEGDRIFAMGEISASAEYPGLTQNSVPGLDIVGMNLEPGHKWAFYWFPGVPAASPEIPSTPFEIGGINEISDIPTSSNQGMTIPADGAYVAIYIYADSLPESTLPSSRFQSVTAEEPNDYAAWISGFFPGEFDPAIVGFDADPDADGLSNGVESILGTSPDAATPGLTAPAPSASGALVFTATLAKKLPDDVARAWEWSRDMVHWFADGAADGLTTVDFTESTIDASNPAFDRVEITAAATGMPLARLFVRLAASRRSP
jgi:hypothetical protein